MCNNISLIIKGKIRPILAQFDKTVKNLISYCPHSVKESRGQVIN